MKKLLKYMLFIATLCLLYFLFEPIVLYNIGKSTIPNLNKLETNNTSEYKEVDQLLKSEYLRLQTPALSVAVGQNNKIIWSNGIGYADIKKKILVDSLTKFRIGSTSKALTSAGVGILLQQQKLTLDSKIKDFVPYATENLSNLTLKQVASHTSGIRNYGFCFCLPIWEYYNNDQYTSIAESLTIFNGDKLLFEPGTDFSYSSYNYTLLSAMIEGASNNEFLAFMQKNVFDPAKLKNTIPEQKQSKIDHVAKFYEVENGNYKESYTINNSNKWAGGGFLSTPSDLVTYGNTMLNYKLIDSVITKKLFTPITLKNGTTNKQNYAIGWRNDISEKVFNDKRKTNVIHHGGTALGSTALLILLPEYNMSIAITMNRSSQSFDLFKLAYQLAELFIENP